MINNSQKFKRSGDINSQYEHGLWLKEIEKQNPLNCHYRNDEQNLIFMAFSYGLIAARKVCGNYDSLNIDQKLDVLRQTDS